MVQNNPAILNCWSDENRFNTNDVVIKYYAHKCSDLILHLVKETRSQIVWGINLWYGLFNEHLLGQYLLRLIWNVERYLNFLLHKMSQTNKLLLDELNIEVPSDNQDFFLWGFVKPIPLHQLC